MEKIFFSAEKLAFYPESLKFDYEAGTGWPDDAVSITQADWVKYISEPPQGQVLGATDEGNPAWVDIPPQSYADLVAQADAQKAAQRAQADSVIAPLQDAVDLGIATPEEVSLLTEWKTYRVRLNRVDTSTAPEIDWPEIPA